jgi:putative ABC transport system ATP-binding protein
VEVPAVTGHRSRALPLKGGGPAETLVRLHGIERTFEQGADRLHALRRIDLEIARGEWISVMGPSGAGKSTLLGVLGMQDFGWTGHYWLAGEPVHDLDIERRARLRGQAIGFVFQSYHLLDDHSVFENLEIPLAYQDLPKRERIARVSETLDRFGLAARRDLHPRQLSGGQQQLVAIARALVGRPWLLLADEPTGSLHSDQADEVMAILHRLHQEGTTILLVTHSDAIAAHGSRTVILRDGWLSPPGASP